MLLKKFQFTSAEYYNGFLICQVTGNLRKPLAKDINRRGLSCRIANSLFYSKVKRINYLFV